MTKRAVMNPNRRIGRRALSSQYCIFCDGTEQLTMFKGKLVCRHCLHHIPNLFLPSIR